jgi:hypothetical protein
MSYRYVEGWRTRRPYPRAAYFLPLLLPAFAILGSWASSLVG